MLNTEYQERRDYIRMGIKGKVVCKVHGADHTFTGSAIDLSHTGMKIETSELLTEGTKMHIATKIGGASVSPLRATFIVKRVQKSGDKFFVAGEMINVR